MRLLADSLVNQMKKLWAAWNNNVQRKQQIN